MNNLTIQERDIPVIKSSLEFKKRSLEFNMKRYRARLNDFEKTYKMSTDNFLKKLNTGLLGDEPQWFEWEYVAGVYEENLKQFEQIDKIQL